MIRPSKKKQQRKAKKSKPRQIKTPYSPTKIKARNYLSNIAYSRICDGDFKNLSFIADALTFITMELEPFCLKMTYGDENDIEMIKMLWEECLPNSFLLYLKKPENFELVYSEKANFKAVKNIVGQYMRVAENCQQLILTFQKYHDIYQYIYSHLFPKTYSKKTGFSKKVQFTQHFNSWKQKKTQQSYVKIPFNYTSEQFRHPMEQEPITNEINIYDDLEFRADIADEKQLQVPNNSPAEKVVDRFLYAPTMVGNEDFDKKFKLPKQKKQKTNADIQAEKKLLEAKLAENNHAMNQIKTGTNILKKTIKKK